MRKLGLESALASGQLMLAQPTLRRRRFALMATTDMPHTHARLTATMALVILRGACL